MSGAVNLPRRPAKNAIEEHLDLQVASDRSQVEERLRSAAVAVMGGSHR
ncbi:hypothetical protein [Nonomuraea roseola]|uniref:Uncharacterized protein n=1 Tax=Nonomuraea roseola TaxID=46179 RepID=A0ABV5QE39_9ACTN